MSYIDRDQVIALIKAASDVDGSMTALEVRGLLNDIAREDGFERAVGDFGQGAIDDECPRPEVGSWTETYRLKVEGRS